LIVWFEVLEKKFIAFRGGRSVFDVPAILHSIIGLNIVFFNHGSACAIDFSFPRRLIEQGARVAGRLTAGLGGIIPAWTFVT